MEMRSHLPRILLLAVPLLAGCTRNTLLVVVPNQPHPLAARCAPPPGTVYTSPGPANPDAAPIMPEPALQAHMAGCAGIAFRLDADGAPRDIRLVAEYPLGYGFGAAGIESLAASRYHPPVHDDSQHYLTVVMVPHGAPVPAPAPPPGLRRSAAEPRAHAT